MKDIHISQIKAIEKKLHSKLVPQPSGCWEWSAGRHPQGYGLVGIGKRKFYVHRLIMCLKLGRLITGAEHVCHKCDNPSCGNPAHLFLGNQYENVRDMYQKGRQNHARGVKAGASKLNPSKVLRLRALYATGQYSYLELSKINNMTTTATRHAVLGITWQHVGGPVKECRIVSRSRDRLKSVR